MYPFAVISRTVVSIVDAVRCHNLGYAPCLNSLKKFGRFIIYPPTPKENTGLKGSIELDSKLGLIELQSLKNKKEIFRSSVNSNNHFEFKKIPEGSYSLMVINDINKDGIYNYGSVFPFKASEWFYSHSDTFKVRANWDIDLGNIDLL